MRFTARLAPLALLAALGSLPLGACATIAPTPQLLTPRTAAPFVALAASSDLFEIESSRLALQRSQNSMIRMHAEMMIRDHGNTSAQLRAAAATAGLAVPTTMLPMHAAMLADLGRSASFDATFRRQQVLSHDQALRAMTVYAARGDVPALRGLAAANVPVIRGHLDHARRM